VKNQKVEDLITAATESRNEAAGSLAGKTPEVAASALLASAADSLLALALVNYQALQCLEAIALTYGVIPSTDVSKLEMDVRTGPPAPLSGGAA
jgi:hypothetical protein